MLSPGIYWSCVCGSFFYELQVRRHLFTGEGASVVGRMCVQQSILLGGEDDGQVMLVTMKGPGYVFRQVEQRRAAAQSSRSYRSQSSPAGRRNENIILENCICRNLLWSC